MKVSIVLPGPQISLSGGIKVIFEYANRLAEHGHEVRLLFWYDIPNMRLGRLPIPFWSKCLINYVRNTYYPRWFKLNKRISKRCIFLIDNNSIPDGDWVFATAVTTADPVSNLSVSKGKKGYLIQGFENWSMPDCAVLSTYSLGFTNVVVSKWLETIVENVAPGSTYLISNPIDDGFYDDNLGRDVNQVSVLYHENEAKGFKDAYEALIIAKAAIPSMHVEAFGIYPRPSFFPEWINYTRCATVSQLRRIYSSSAAYICASVNEGFGLTGLEALACGAALISTDYQGAADYAINGENALLSPIGNPQALANNLIKVLSDDILRSNLALSAKKTAVGRSWDIAVESFESIISNSGRR